MTPEPAATNENGAKADPKTQVKIWVGQFEAWLDLYMVKKAPFQIPMGGKEFLAIIAPYLVILGAISFLFSLAVFLGLGKMRGIPMTNYIGWGIPAMIAWIGSAFAVGLELFALPGLFRRTSAAWRLVFYATLVSFAGSVFSLNLIGAVIGGAIGWYLLFQIKELYKN